MYGKTRYIFCCMRAVFITLIAALTDLKGDNITRHAHTTTSRFKFQVQNLYLSERTGVTPWVSESFEFLSLKLRHRGIVAHPLGESCEFLSLKMGMSFEFLSLSLFIPQNLKIRKYEIKLNRF